MRYVFAISMFLFVAACAPPKPRDPRTISGIDSTIQPYIDMYTSLKGSGLGYDIPIAFVDQPGNVIGVCIRWSNGYRQIEVDPDYWNSPFTSQNERVALIFHELGHCDLNRDHVSSIMSNGLPSSLMYPYNYGFPSTWQSYYFDELFNPTASISPEIRLASHDAGCVHDIGVVE